MGRWGHRLFEGDNDLDHESEVLGAIHKKLKAKGINLSDDHLVGFLDNMENLEFRPAASPINAQTLRHHLEDKICEELFNECRNKKDSLFGDYPAVILGAVMMKTGAQISTNNRAYLRQVGQQAESHAGFRLPIWDLGFRHPGKAQFLAAVNHYVNGQPRDFSAPSCFSCGRINADLVQRILMKCGRCKQAWYCNTECQRANWDEHKRSVVRMVSLQ